jgi:hypothetical protein
MCRCCHDALNEADHEYMSTGQWSVKQVGGIDDGSKARRAVTICILRVCLMNRCYYVCCLRSDIILYLIRNGYVLERRFDLFVSIRAVVLSSTFIVHEYFCSERV